MPRRSYGIVEKEKCKRPRTSEYFYGNLETDIEFIPRMTSSPLSGCDAIDDKDYLELPHHELEERDNTDIFVNIHGSAASDGDVRSDQDDNYNINSLSFISTVSKDGQDPLWSISQIQAKISATDFPFLILSLQRKYRLTDVAINTILQLFRLTLPVGVKCVTSIKMIEKLLDHDTSGLQIKYSYFKICNECFQPLPLKQITSEEICNNSSCLLSAVHQRPSEFVTFSIMEQLKFILRNHGSTVLKFLSSESKLKTFVSDIIDSDKYLSYGQNPCNNLLWINLILSADGARPQNARRGSLWPCDAIVAELPPKIRCSYDNAVVFGFWFSSSKPNWNIFLTECLKELEFLKSCGFDLLIGNTIYKIRVRLICGVFDLVARASIWNVMQFNGEYGCMDCMHPGYQIKRGHRIWPHIDNLPQKNSSWYQKAYHQQESCGKTVMGIKGRSKLNDFLDVGSQNPIDIMHQSYEGVFKMIAKRMFENGSGNSWYLGKPKVKKEVDFDFQSIRWPHEFRRTVLPLNMISQFKASEYKNLLLYAIVPVTKKYLSNVEDDDAISFYHFLVLFTDIIRRLTCDIIPRADFTIIKRMVTVFLELLPKFLTELDQTFNVHITQHLPKYALLFGPLHQFSTFSFEGFNGLYARLPTSCHGSLHQIARRFLHERKVIEWLRRKRSGSGTLSSFIDKNFKLKDSLTNIIECPDTFMDESIPNIEISAIIDVIDINVEILSAHRLTVDKILFHSKLYRESLIKRCSYNISYIDDNRSKNYGEIQRFIKVNGEFFAVIRQFTIESENIVDDLPPPTHETLQKLYSERAYGSYFKVARLSHCCVCIPAIKLCKICILIKSDNETSFLTEIANFYEHD